MQSITGRSLRFNNDQLYEFTQRFSAQSVNQQMSHKQFRDSLGLIGMQSLSFLADRMFTVMDKDKKGYITLGDYLCYLDVLMYGSEDEKLSQSFQLLDQTDQGRITFEDFKRIVQQFAQMWSAALGTPSKFLNNCSDES